MIKLLILITALLSCGSEKKKKPDPVVLLDADQKEFLQAKFDNYKELSGAILDEKNWITDTKCDATLFQSLYSIATDIGSPYNSEDPETRGKYYRHHSRSCYQNHKLNIPGGSSSETSRDMYIGVLYKIILDNDKTRLSNIERYGKRSNWVMGESDNFGATEFRPDTIGLLYQIQHFMGLGNNPSRFVQPDYSDCKDFSCHLRSLIILMRFEMGLYTERDSKELNRLIKIDERNALFFAIHAYIEQNRESAQKAYFVLSGDEFFPTDKLPTSEKKCGFYLWEREPKSSAWKPCPEKKPDQIWSGVDFLFASHILLMVK